MRKSTRLLVYFISILVLIFGFALRFLWQEKPVVLPKNQYLIFIATVKNEPKISYDKQVIAVGDGKVYTSLFPKYRVGDRLKIEGKVDDVGRIFNAKVEKVEEVSSIWYLVSGIRTKIADNIQSMLPSREATLVVGSVLGVDNIDADFRDQLIKTGTIHVVVVSGQNLAIVAGLFLGLPKFLGRKFSLVLATIVVFSYALLTGFQPPVIRASLMVLASSLAVFWGREAVPILNLLVAALIIAFIWPSAIFEVSFQLTFAASLGIMTLGRKLSTLMRGVPDFVGSPEDAVGPTALYPRPTSSLHSNLDIKISKSLDAAGARRGAPTRVTQPNVAARNVVSFLVGLFGENFAIATSAFLFTAPVIYFHFQRLSILSPITNVLVAEAVAPIMILGFLISGATLIFMPLAQLLAYLVFVPAFYFVKVVEIFASF